MRGNVNFYLKKPEKNGYSLILLKFKYSGNQFFYSFGETIKPAQWNKNKQRVKQNIIATTKDGKQSINKLLDKLQEIVITTYRNHLANGVPPKAILKEALDNHINQNKNDDNKPSFKKLLERFISGEILNKGKEKSINTIKTYKTLQGHLNEFEKVKKMPVNYDSINLDWLSKYIKFLRDHFKLGQNAIAKDVQILKTIMRKANTLQQTTNLWHEHEDFTAAREMTDAVYITDNELLKLYRFDFTSNKRLEAIRDLFIFGCYVGLRYSDYSKVKPENIVQIENEEGKNEYFIKMITQKTGELVIIPCNPVVLQIFEKYSSSPNKLPKAISNQKFNEGIKEVCKIAAYAEDGGVKEMKEKGRLATDPGQELWQCISSHTARRSFATNLYLEGFPVIDLMKITGHKTEKAFMQYIRVTKLDAAKRLNIHMQKRWSQKLLKVA